MIELRNCVLSASGSGLPASGRDIQLVAGGGRPVAGSPSLPQEKQPLHLVDGRTIDAAT